MGAWLTWVLCAVPLAGGGMPVAGVDVLYSGQRSAQLIEGVTLPYCGYGGVMVLDDNRLLVEVNGVQPEEPIEQAGLHFGSGDVQVLDLGVEASELVRLNDSWTLTPACSGGVQAGPADERVLVVPVEAEGCDVNSLLDMVGWILIARDEVRGGVVVQVLSDTIEPVSFAAVLQPAEVAVRSNQSNCTANCTNGECGIQCSGQRAAVCWCDKDGVPHCQCIKPPKPEDDVVWKPVPMPDIQDP